MTLHIDWTQVAVAVVTTGMGDFTLSKVKRPAASSWPELLWHGTLWVFGAIAVFLLFALQWIYFRTHPKPKEKS